MKKFQLRQNHRAHLNKRINDNLREVQLLELQQEKEKFELEMLAFEQVGNKKAYHDDIRAQLALSQMNSAHAAKEKDLDKKQLQKRVVIIQGQEKEYQSLQKAQLYELDQLNKKNERFLNLGQQNSKITTSWTGFMSEMNSRENLMNSPELEAFSN